MILPNSHYLEYNHSGGLLLPNIKKIFLADEGMKLADVDLSGADIQVVAWDSNCRWLMDYFSKPQDKKVYAYIASMFFQRDIDDKGAEYKQFKAIFHGVNYLLGLTKLAAMAGIPYSLAKELRDFYFTLNPEIPKWHDRLQSDVNNKGYITNAFGRRMWFLNKNNKNLMNEVAAGIPQSTIGDVVNRGWVAIRRALASEGVRILMQVHDSLLCQYPIEKAEAIEPRLLELMKIEIPYEKKLIIPSDMKTSVKSYGDCKKSNNFKLIEV